MSNDSTTATLVKLAKAHPKRADFNRSLKEAFGKPLGSGAFRTVFAADKETVIKVRRSRPNGSGFRMCDIQDSNREEAEAYEQLVDEDPIFAQFVLPPIYIALPNNHDAVMMKRVEKVWGKLSQCVREKHERDDTLIGRQYRIISNVFEDSHWDNIGIMGNRVFLIDMNQGFYGKHWRDAFREMAINVLTELGVLDRAEEAGA